MLPTDKSLLYLTNHCLRFSYMKYKLQLNETICYFYLKNVKYYKKIKAIQNRTQMSQIDYGFPFSRIFNAKVSINGKNT